MSGEVWQLNDGVLEWREVEGEIVALDRRSSTYLAVNQTGTVLWPFLAEGATEQALAGALVAEYGIDEPTAGQDVRDFLEALKLQELVVSR